MKRLKTMCQTSDGFEIAQKDLALRGPGDFFGSRQHGLPKLKIANLLEDMEVLEQSREAVRKVIEIDPELTLPENKNLKEMVEGLFEELTVDN